MATSSPDGTVSSDILIADYYDKNLTATVMLSFFCLFGIPGNILVLLVSLKGKKMTGTNFLIFIMAMVDFIGALTALLNVIKYTVWFDILDVGYCKLVTTLNYTSNTPAIYLIFGVSVLRYYHVCKPDKLASIHKLMKPFLFITLIVSLGVAEIHAVCSGKKPWTDEEKGTKGFNCGNVPNKYKCKEAYDISFISIMTTYIFCLIALFGLNIRILYKMYQQRNVRDNKKGKMKLEKTLKKALKHESAYEVTESQPTSKHDLDEAKDDTIEVRNSSIRETMSYKSKKSAKSIKDNMSFKSKKSMKSVKSIKGEEEESIDMSINVEETADNPTGQQMRDRLKSTKSMKSSKSVKTDISQNDLRQGESKSEMISLGQTSNDVQNVETDKGPTEVISMPNMTDQELDKQIKKRFCGKCCHNLRFEGLNRTTLKISFVSIAYLVIWFPWFVFTANLFYGNITQGHLLYKYLYQPIKMLPFAGCAVNPVIYAFVDPKFRSQCRALFCKK